MAKNKKSKNAADTRMDTELATESRPIVHLVCQAHIDPVWMWTWQEGAREGISTLPTMRWSSPSETTCHTVFLGSRPARLWST